MNRVPIQFRYPVFLRFRKAKNLQIVVLLKSQTLANSLMLSYSLLYAV